MAKGEKRLTIEGLIPGEKYAIQVRAVDDGAGSPWSQKYNVETIDDTAGGTRTPAPPAIDEWKVDAAGQYIAIWNNVNQNTDGTPLVVKFYELGLTAAGFPEVIVNHGGITTGSQQSRIFNFGHLRTWFGGTIPTTLSARLRVVNSAGTISEWSEPKVASLPVPNPPKNVTAQPVVDGIKLKWEPPDDPIYLVGYRVYMSMTDPNFVPSIDKMVYQGSSLEFTYTSLSYDYDHWFKVVSHSEPGLESTTVNPVPTPNRPISPYGPDDIAPEKPTLGTPSMDRTVLTAPKANLTWTIDEGHANNQDISGFVIRWKVSGGTDGWRNAYFDKAARAGVIDLPQPFANYEFEIAAYDFVANYSDYTGTGVTLTGATAPPPAVANVRGVPRWDGLEILWDASNESVKYGGVYQVQVNTTGTFANNTPDYTTSNLSINLTGLTSLEEYFYRVRAIDSANQAGPWSSVVSSTLPAFPAAQATDGVAPGTAPQNVRATGGLNYVNIAWDRVNNADAVFYKVYIAEDAGFADSEQFLAGVSSGTSLMVSSLYDGTPLVQNTEYFFRVRASDADGDGPRSAEVSSELTQVLSTDLGINMGGENLYFNSSFDADADINGVADYWAVYNNSSQTEPATPSLVTWPNTPGKAQRVQWTGVNTSTKGIYSINSSVLRPRTEYVLSFNARAGTLANAQAGTGFSLHWNVPPATPVTWMQSPTPDPVTPQRYIAKFTTGNTVDPANVFISIAGHTANGGWVEFDDIQIEAGNVASAYKTGTMSIAKLATGKFQSADMIIATGGRVVSQTYLNNPNTGFLITDSGITIKDGQVDAKTLVANSTITNNLYIGALLEIASGGIIESANYDPGVAGFRLSSVGLDIRSGTVGAGTLVAGTISSPDIKVGAGGKITIDANGSIVSNNYNGPNDAGVNTGFKISNLGIEMWDSNSKINVNALETSTMTARTITIGSGGTLQSADWATSGPVRWQLAENAFTMVGGTITGSTIITDQIYSASSEVAGGVSRRKFSINNEGYAEFSGVKIYGNAVVGGSESHVIQSATWNGSTGWQIRGDGWAQFFQINTWNQNVYGTLTVGTGGNYSVMRSNNHASQSTGWFIDSNGYAEFNGGSFRIGSVGGALVWLLDGGGSQGQIRFYLPGNGAEFNYIRANGAHLFEMRGAYGGAVELWSRQAWDGHALVRLIQDAHVTQTMWIDNGLIVSGGGIEMNGNLKMNSYADGSGGVRRLDIQDNGLVVLGGTSSERYKDNIIPLSVSKKQVLSLEPVEFDWNKEATRGRTGRGVGVIAEQAEELGLTQFVYYQTDRDGVKTVDGFDYEGFTSALLVVAREQQEEIDDLKSRLDRLEKLVKRGS